MSENTVKKRKLDRLQIANLNRLNRTNELLISKNTWFYLAITSINIVTLVIAWLIESNINGVATGIFDGFDYRYLYLILTSLITLVLMKVLPEYIYLYKKTKCRLFFGVVRSNIMSEYYKTLTYGKKNADGVCIETLKEAKVNDAISKEMTNTNNVSNTISGVIYYFLTIALGSFFVLDNTNLLLYILAIIGLVFNIIYVLLILYFEKYKTKYLVAIGGLCKILYRLKIVKDYEKLYDTIVVRFIQYGSVFKKNKLFIVCQIVCGVLIKLISHLILFFIICAFNLGSWEILLEVLLKCSILDIVLGMFPMPKGTLIYELLFIVLFRVTFVSGYVLYGMLIYRTIRYFLLQLIFGIGYVFGIRKRIEKIRQQISEEVKVYDE